MSGREAPAVSLYTDDDVQELAEGLLRTYDSEYSSAGLTWRNFENEARRYLDANAPTIAARALREAADDYGTPGATATTSYVRGFLRDRADEIERTAS